MFVVASADTFLMLATSSCNVKCMTGRHDVQCFAKMVFTRMPFDSHMPLTSEL